MNAKMTPTARDFEIYDAIVRRTVSTRRVAELQHVAADRLEYQYCELMENWHEKGDPKYLRQATRIALAQARLGVMAGRIECLAADAIEGPLEVPFAEGTEPAGSTRSEPATCENPPERDCSRPATNSQVTRPAAVRRGAASAGGGDTSYSLRLGRASNELEHAAEIERALLSASVLPASAEAISAVA
jgi:hypothetical protein